MMRASTKPLLGGAAIAAAVVLFVVLLPTSGAHAQVRCLSDGWSWHCQDGYLAPAPGPIATPGWGYGYGENYNDAIPDDYPGPAPVYNNRY